jgi:myo-inositol-1(or 4)-monophosphatase
MAPDLSSFFEFAVETAYLAGKSTLAYFRTDLSINYKADDTPVTIADRGAEELIRSRIEKRYPDHAIVGEEFGQKVSQGSSYRWLVDPIDGTKAFIHGVPLYSVLIGLEIDGEVKVGAVYFPALDEMLGAANGLGCWCNGRRVQVSTETRLERSVVTYTSALAFERYQRGKAWQRLCQATYFQAGWSDAYAFALVASGRVEIGIDPLMTVWDCGPFPPILREAGGYFGDWKGNSTVYGGEGLATSQAQLGQVLALLNQENVEEC